MNNLLKKFKERMQKKKVSFLRLVFSWPAFVFWLGFFGHPGGILSAVALFMVSGGSEFVVPSFSELLERSSTISIIRGGVIISGISMLIIGYIAHNFYRRFINRPYWSLGKHMKSLIIVLDSFCILNCASMVLATFLSRSKLFHLMNLLYFITGLGFHALIDYIAGHMRRFVALSNGTNIVILVIAAVSCLCYICGSVPYLKECSYLLVYLEIVLISMKCLFTGIYLLGGRFLPGGLRVVGSAVRRNSYSDGSVPSCTVDDLV